LGNIFTLSDDYPTQVFKMDQAITLQEGKENSVLGRAVVVHGKIMVI
jgi:peroxiredoxin